MKYRYLFRAMFSLFVIFLVFSRNLEAVEVNVPSSIKESIEEAAPAEAYCFYAFKEHYPTSIDDLKKMKLFVCGEVENQADITVLMASLNDFNSLLFKSIHHCFINPKISMDKFSTSEILFVKSIKGRVPIKITRDKSIYGKDTSMDALVNNCFEKMRKTNNSVLLIKKSIGSQVLDQMVEIKFNAQD